MTLEWLYTPDVYIDIKQQRNINAKIYYKEHKDRYRKYYLSYKQKKNKIPKIETPIIFTLEI